MEHIPLKAMLRRVEDREVIRDSQNSFTKDKSCLTHLVANVTTSDNKRRATDVVYLDFCKAFDTVPHKNFLSNLERYGFDRWTVWRLRNWLDGGIQGVVIKGSICGWTPVTSGVPQGSVWDQYCLVSSSMTQTLRSSAPSAKFDDTKLSGAVDIPEGPEGPRQAQGPVAKGQGLMVLN